MNVLLIILAVIAAVLAARAVNQIAAERRDRQHFPPPCQMVDVGGYRLHLKVMGEATSAPTVILEAGMVSFSSNWAWVQPELAKVTRVVALDRAGLGWSDPGPKPRDAGQSARELHSALAKLSIPAPYVLAGHSYGGLAIRAFAALYPDEIAGMVLVDASHPDQWVRMGVPSKSLFFGNKMGALLARFGLFLFFFKGEYQRLTGGLPQQRAAELMAFTTTPRALSTVADVVFVWDSISRPLVADAGDLGDLPLVVLSVTEQPTKGELLTALQAELTVLSNNSQHITVQDADHEGLVSCPEYAHVVTESILRVVEAAREGTSLVPRSSVEAS